MITSPMPTRAEVMDVANAVLDGTDAVMLSAETAAGDFPEETVQAMARVCLGAEKHPSARTSSHRLTDVFSSVEETIAMATMYAANHLEGIKGIVALTESGTTPLLMSRITSNLPIIALSRHQSALNRMALIRGVAPLQFDSSTHTEDTVIKAAIECAKQSGLIVVGDTILLTKGDMMETVGGTNTCKIVTVS